jgi:hypothetical protein
LLLEYDEGEMRLFAIPTILRLRIAAFAASVGVIAGTFCNVHASDSPAHDGLFNLAQAARGEWLYGKHCVLLVTA